MTNINTESTKSLTDGSNDTAENPSLTKTQRGQDQYSSEEFMPVCQ